MSIYSIYFSPTQGTKVITNTLAQEIGTYQEIDLCEYTDQIQERIFWENDICLIGVPAYGGRVPRTAAERIKGLKGNGALAVLVVSYGNRDYDDTLIELYDVVKAQGFTCVSGVTAIAEHSIMHKFAAGRPDETDQKELREFGKRVREYLEHQEKTGELSVPGNHPYKELGTIPFIPKPGKACNSCGRCAALCPVGAIDLNNVKKVDEEKCISCMRCIAVCPKHARSLNKVVLFAAEKKMAKLFETRKENELFLGEAE